MILAPGWRWNVHHDSRRLIRPCAEPAIFRPCSPDLRRHRSTKNRRAVLIRDDKPAVSVGRLHLIVSRKRHRSFSHPDCLRRVDAGAGNCGTDSFAGQTERGDSLSISVSTRTAGRCPPASVTSPDAGDLRDLSAPRGFLPCPTVIGIVFEVTSPP